jgi:Tol biopolymer transport system component
VTPVTPQPQGAKVTRDPRETHLAGLRQLTFGGENAEAYWSFDGSQLIYQARQQPAGRSFACDQIFVMPATGGEARLVSTGKGRTTCSYFFPGNRRILYASTHLAGEACPPEPDMSKGYVWPLYDSFDIFSARADGAELKAITSQPGYDAEATVCPKDGSIVFTSTRDNDIELYRMDADGKNVRRLTHTPGYDGGAFFSPDCKQIVWRASRPRPGKELDDFKGLLAQGLVRPSKLELYVANADGTDARQITYLGAASFGPSFFPDGKRIVFSSNYGDPKGREFEIWAIDVDGTNLERITFSPGFDGFPLFSPDGKRLVFASNRDQAKEGDTNVFVSEWSPETSAEARVPVPADSLKASVAWLADDAREGRGVGTAGLDASATWLEAQYAARGLAPAGEKGFRHPLDVVVAVKAGDKTALELDGVATARESFEPAGFSTTGEVSAPVVFVEWGVTAPDLGHDDYKGKNVKGKIVVARRFTPEGGRFEDKYQRRFSDPRYKAWNAREHGAKALILVDLPKAEAKAAPPKPPAPATPGAFPAAPQEAPIPKLGLDAQGDAGLPVVFVKRAQLEKLPRRARVSVELLQEKKAVDNIIGKLEATGPNKLPGLVVIGAHYDHLGFGNASSLAPGVRAVHNGADDNASGVGALLEVASLLASRKAELRRDVLFMAFTAEEMGVLGSTAVIRRPPPGLDPKQVVAMLNMDMVGRMRDNRVEVLGAESAAEWKDVAAAICDTRRVRCELRGDGYGPSDHMPFYAAGIPVLHFFTGAHSDYHRPTDDLDMLNAAGAAATAGVVADVAVAVGARDTRLTYKVAPPPEPRGDLRLSGASLGTVPDYGGPADGSPGILLAGVRPGSAAEKAGMTRGDVLIAVDGHAVRNIEDLMFVLQRATPGQKAVVTFMREGKKLEAETVFGAPSRR